MFFSNSGILFFQTNIIHMFLFVQVLSTLIMEFHYKILYTCRELVLAVSCIFWKFIILIIYIYFKYQNQYIPEITMSFVRVG